MFENAKWIGRNGRPLSSWKSEILSAPMFRYEFELTDEPKEAVVSWCGLGYSELYVNGEKIGDSVLSPTVTVYDKRVRYVQYDISTMLQRGRNIFGMILGNGWYNCHTRETWYFDKASWRDYPKLILQADIMLKNGQTRQICSSDDWKVTSSGPILFDGLREGEFYDARKAIPDWNTVDFKADNWRKTLIVPPPGGIMEAEKFPPCRVTRLYDAVSMNKIDEETFVYDFKKNITGWVQLHLQNVPVGTEITIKYSDRLHADGMVDMDSCIGSLILAGEAQTDKYIACGDQKEIWSPRFTYHGFQYIQIKGLKHATIDNVKACFIHTDFGEIGSFVSANNDLNLLQELTKRSYLSNFTGIPTDCPHREKNGWTGDAHLACETGLFNYDSSASYLQWLDTMADCQRPSGQFPGIVPSSGWGYNWGSGPAWDNAFILIPWYIYLYTGNDTAIIKHYDAIKHYMDYCNTMSKDYVISFGLGDWSPYDKENIVPAALTSTAYYYLDAVLCSRFAEISGNIGDIAEYTRLAENIKNAFNRNFYKGDGIYANGKITALGCALYQGLVEDREKQLVADKLAQIVKRQDFICDFGILGAKYVPRALAENGYGEYAYKMFTQEKYPGYINWIRNGATSLHESWESGTSLNHIMFGDISAWCYNYLGGIMPDAAKPGFENVIINPCFPVELDYFSCSYKSVKGTIKTSWQRTDGKVEFNYSLPAGVIATVLINDQTVSVKQNL